MSLPPKEYTQVITMVQEGTVVLLEQREYLRLQSKEYSNDFKRPPERPTNIRRSGNGMPRCLTTPRDRFIVSTMLKNGRLTVVKIQNSLQEIRDKLFTIQRKLREADLKPYKLLELPRS